MDKATRKLANRLVEPLREATRNYRKGQDTRYIPFQSMESSVVKGVLDGEFLENDKIKELRQEVIEGKNDLRVIGFSGIGKTRIVCEAFKGSDNYNVFYCNCAKSEAEAIRRSLELLLDEKQNGLTVILDNCNRDFLDDLMESRKNARTECRIISMNYDMNERKPSFQKIVFRKLIWDFSQSVVEDMVAQRNLSEEDSKLIIHYSSSLPYMTKLLLDSGFGNGIAQLPEGKIYDRILNIDANTEENKEHRIVLTALSIFRSLGFFDNLRPDMEFVAKNQILTHWSAPDRYKIRGFCQTEKIYEERGIIERLGNMVSIRPIPVAIHLAGEWYRTLDESAMVQLCQDFENYSHGNVLVEALAIRGKYMGHFAEARNLVAKLMVHDAPFHKKEVVFSELGSRLFLAFTEVNPVACAHAVWDIMKAIGQSDQKALNRRGRSNILFALDHLCFDKRSFREGMLSLAKLSLYEPESYDNNSKGLFKERYTVMLPSTEANYKERLNILDEIYKWGPEYYSLIFQSCLMAMRMGSFHRMGGPEYQGDEMLQDYSPRTMTEVEDYQSRIFDVLMLLCDKNKEWMEKAAKQFTENIWQYFKQHLISVMRKGFDYFYPKIGSQWPDMKRALMIILETDRKSMNTEYITFAEEWLEKVTPLDFVSRYSEIDNEISYREKFDIDTENKERIVANKELAKEFVEHNYFDQETVTGLYKSDKMFTYFFAQALVELIDEDIDKIRKFIDMSLDSMGEGEILPDRYSLFVYFVGQMKNKVGVDYAMEIIKEKQKYRLLLLAITAIRLKDVSEVESLLKGIDIGKYKISDFRWFLRYINLTNNDAMIFMKLYNRFMDYGEDGARLALNYIGHTLSSDKTVNDEIEKTAIRMYRMIDIRKDKIINNYAYRVGLSRFLQKYHHPELAMHVHQQFEDALIERDLDSSEAYKLYGVILKEYKDEVWPMLKKSLDDERKLNVWTDFLRMNYIINNETDNPPISSLISDDEWKEWLEQTPVDKDLAATRLLEMVRWYKNDGTLLPMFAFLMKKYFKAKTIFKDNFACWHDSYSYIGSGYGIYNLRIKVDKNLAKLNNSELHDWAITDIVYWEKVSNEESLSNAHRQALEDSRFRDAQR